MVANLLKEKKNLQTLNRFQEQSTDTPTFTTQNMQNLYGIRHNLKPLQPLLPQLASSQRHKDYDQKIIKIKQSQKKLKNVHNPQVEVNVSEHFYNLNGDSNNNEVSEQNAVHVSPYIKIGLKLKYKQNGIIWFY